MMPEMISKLTRLGAERLRKTKPETSGTDTFQKEVRRQLGDKPSDIERDGGPSYLPATYNSAAANRERDGVPKIADTNSAAANKERDGEAPRSSRYAKGGSVSASRRGDGIAQRGKTKGRMC